MALLSVVLVLAASTVSFACACCADRGTYSISTGKVDTYWMGLLADMKFGPKAELYSTEAGFEGIKGVGAIEKEYNDGTLDHINIIDAFTENSWSLTFNTPKGSSGALALPLPTRMTIRKVDIPDNTSTATNVVLYKEAIFKGTVAQGLGVFKSGIVRPTTYTLIFQGKGNFCDNAEDFTNWRLEVKGKKADYVLFGKMKAADPS